MAYQGTQQTLQANQEQSRLSQQASHDLLISQQVAKGFEHLGQQGPDKMVLRLGGIYALEGVMNGSEQYHQAVLEALCAFVREGTRTHNGEDVPPATDIQAALTVIARRNPGSWDVDLMYARIPQADLSGADLSGADLSGASLTSANLSGANLTGTDLSGTNLTSADLSDLGFGHTHWNGIAWTAVFRESAIVKQSQLDLACGEDTKLPPGLTLKPCPKP